MNAVKASTVQSRFRRQVTSVMLVLSLSLGAIVATPTPAHAAGSHIGVQFSMNGYFPAPYSFGVSDMADETAQVWLSFDGRSWFFHTYFKLNQLGRVD
ncbi:MAG TPA: hypothetical protein VMS54_01495, partial [Vicinamibacterales bacterium]|nr:hypothetical protein [Vicinamibacterales bacterium]